MEWTKPRCPNNTRMNNSIPHNNLPSFNYLKWVCVDICVNNKPLNYILRACVVIIICPFFLRIVIIATLLLKSYLTFKSFKCLTRTFKPTKWLCT